MISSLFLALVLNAFGAVQHTPAELPADRCEEDEPCWSCETMGNKRCGPQVRVSAACMTTDPILFPCPTGVTIQEYER